jgi:FkbM family methyltransferase
MSLKADTLDLVKAVFAHAGLSIGWHLAPGTHQRLLNGFFRQNSVNCVLDVGGFNGTYAKELRGWGYRGLIISFEPVPASYALLREKMKADPLWIGQPYGLSNENRRATMKTYAKGDFNSLLSLRDDAAKAYGLNASERSEVDIELRRLDTAMRELRTRISSDARIFVKIDTQGHDLEVPQGASGILDVLRGFQSELPAVRIYDGMHSMPELIEYYSQIGFVPIGFFPVNTFPESLVSPEFDVLFTRFSGTLQRRAVPY